MTQEEKAKRYDNALEKARQLCAYPTSKPFISDLQDLFHELKESKDEKIRKLLLESFKSLSNACTKNNCYRDDISYKDVVAWLEKQGNLVKYYEDKLDRCACENFNKGYKKALEKQGKNNMGISEATKQELEDNLNKALEKETPESCNEFLDEQGEQNPTIEMKTPEESLGIDSDTYNKIVDECIYGEQKPIKEHNACEFCEDRYGCVSPCSMKLIEEEKPVDKVESRQEELTEFEKAVKQVMEEAIECGDTHNLKADADMLLRLVQKPAWSEKDEKILNLIIARLHSHPNVEVEEYGKDYHWLKSLKERVGHFDDGYKVGFSAAKYHQWKPSGEQMLAINTAINVLGKGTINGKYLIELHEQLKKLKG